MKRYLLSAMLLLGAAAPALANESVSKLSPELQQKVQATHAKYKDQMKPLWQDARAARQALKDELGKPQPSDATLSQLEDRLQGDRQRMMTLHQQAQSELRSQLSPKELAQLMLARGDHFRGHHMHRGDGGGGEQQ